MDTENVGVVILGGGRGTRLEPLTEYRAKPAVPVGGKYRLVDIPISNAIHSGMTRMVLLTQYNSVSLHRHIVRSYRFENFSTGYVQLLAAQQTAHGQHGERWFQGTADAVRQCWVHINEVQGDHLLILAGDHMYRMDYREMLATHLESDADITIAVQPCTAGEIGGFGALRVDEDGAVREFREKPGTEEAREGMALSEDWLEARGYDAGQPYLASMGIYIFKKQVLADALAGDAVDFGRDVLPAAVRAGQRVQSFFFTGYWKDIGTIGAFYEAHMELLGPDAPFRFDDNRWPIFTRARFLPCARISGTRIDRSLIAEGTRLEDCEVSGSIIGIRSIARDAVIRDSFIVGVDPRYPELEGPPVGIGAGTHISTAIIDKNARIGCNVRLVNEAGVREASGDGWVIKDGVIVVPKNGIIPDGTVV